MIEFGRDQPGVMRRVRSGEQNQRNGTVNNVEVTGDEDAVDPRAREDLADESPNLSSLDPATVFLPAFRRVLQALQMPVYFCPEQSQ